MKPDELYIGRRVNLLALYIDPMADPSAFLNGSVVSPLETNAVIVHIVLIKIRLDDGRLVQVRPEWLYPQTPPPLTDPAALEKWLVD